MSRSALVHFLIPSFVVFLSVSCSKSDETGDDSASTGGSTSTGGNTSTGGTGGADDLDGSPRWLGRVDASDPEAVRFAWQGAGLIATVSGSMIAVELRTEGTPVVYFQPVIDGEPGERFGVTDTQEVILAEGLSEGPHQVELYRETEGRYGVSTFLGFSAGEVLGAPADPGRLIEVVGDSISAGYGNLGEEPHPNWVADPACHYTAENSSWYATYAAQAGRALGAEVSTVAVSGWGMSRELGGGAEGVLSSVYENALGTADPTPYAFERKADAVVINLGTNDWGEGDPGEAYELAYFDFIATVRTQYPSAWIVLTIGSMTGEPELTEVKTRLSNVVSSVQEATGDEKLLTFDLGTQNLGADGSIPSGCDWHPNVADHERMAGILESQLSAALGWE